MSVWVWGYLIGGLVAGGAAVVSIIRALAKNGETWDGQATIAVLTVAALWPFAASVISALWLHERFTTAVNRYLESRRPPPPPNPFDNFARSMQEFGRAVGEMATRPRPDFTPPGQGVRPTVMIAPDALDPKRRRRRKAVPAPPSPAVPERPKRLITFEKDSPGTDSSTG